MSDVEPNITDEDLRKAAIMVRRAFRLQPADVAQAAFQMTGHWHDC